MLGVAMSGERRTALIAVDVQRDFLPGGSLAVRDGDGVIAPLLELVRTSRRRSMRLPTWW